MKKPLSKALRAHLLARPQPLLERVDLYADRYGFSASTLRRHLAAEGTNWNAIMDGVLRERTEELQGFMCAVDIARTLGYVEMNSFYRAYRRWHGYGFAERLAA